jgi:hypothetical protein
MARKTRFVTWNGQDLPREFCDLPAGRYIVEAVDEEAPALSLDEEAGIEAALESYRQGHVVDAKRAREMALVHESRALRGPGLDRSMFWAPRPH